jgi:hypothetical protein
MAAPSPCRGHAPNDMKAKPAATKRKLLPYKQETLRKSHASRARTRIGRWRAAFLEALAKTPSVTVAARAAGVGRRTVYDARDRDEEFAEQWDDALAQSIDALEAHAYLAAIRGDSQLMQFFLKAHKPFYRENARLDIGLLGGIVQIPCKSEGAE